jgi:hypothetical protein
VLLLVLRLVLPLVIRPVLPLVLRQVVMAVPVLPHGAASGGATSATPGAEAGVKVGAVAAVRLEARVT